MSKELLVNGGIFSLKIDTTYAVDYSVIPVFDGVQLVVRLDNNWGISAINHSGASRGKFHLWEVAIVEFFGENLDDWEISPKYPIESFQNQQQVDFLIGCAVAEYFRVV